jgi:hypothetical protein
MGQLAKDYYRFQATIGDNLGLDTITDDDIAALKQLGADIVTQR